MEKIIFTLIIIHFSLIIASGQWIMQHTGTTGDLYGISFINENTGYVCGSSTIIKTTNGGTNWYNVNTINLYKPFMKIQVIDEYIVYCVGMFNTIIKSTNGGSNWNIIRNGPSGTGVSFFALYFINSLTGWIGGQYENSYILKTTNGGETFDSILTNNLLGRVQDFYFKNANTGLVCGNLGILRKTSNGGYNWNNVNIPVGGYLYDFRNLSFIDTNIGYTVSGSRKVFKTTDYGSNWDSLLSIPSDITTHHICFSSGIKGWVVGTQYDVFHTSNGGLNWYPQGGGGGSVILFINASIGWKAGNMGIVFKTTNGGIPTFVNESKVIIKDFQLIDNYPNPFNSQTIIKYNIFKNDLYFLELFNTVGKREMVLFSQQKNIGEYKFLLSVDNLPSGLYYLKLSNSKNYNIKKIILLK
jgi:photosystem II stability/assembly factor-like uncharacterized protein